MKQNKIFIFGVLFFCFIVAASFFTFQSKTKRSNIDSQTQSVASVSVTFDTGSTIATVSGISAQNVHQALVIAAKKQNLILTIKQYDFGVFVEAIGTLANTKEKSWIYFVNGKSGTVAADKQSLKSGDLVEWKYMIPNFE
jgi:hypothetical protein